MTLLNKGRYHRMSIYHFLKLFTITLHYGWFGIVYGILFALSLEDHGFEVASWMRVCLSLGTLVLSVGVAYAVEMRYHMPSHKYWTIVVLTLLGVFGLASYPYLYPLSFVLFLAMICYRCKDCVAYTRAKR